MNPFLITGPELNPESLNTTTEMFVNIFNGKFPGIFSLGWGFVDVRDVAKAHILAMKKEDAEGRYLLCNQTIMMEDCIERLRKKYPNYSLPTTHLNCSTGDLLVKFSSYFQDKGTGQYLRTNVGKIFKFDNSKSKTLGLKYRDLNETIFDTVDDLIQKGHIPDLREKEKDFILNLQKEMSEPQNGLKLKDRTRHLHSYQNTFTGKEAVDWLMGKTGNKHRISAVKLGQDMLTLGKIRHVTNKQDFVDDKDLYVFVE